MSEEQVRAIVRDEINKLGGIDIGDAIALHVRTVTANMLKQLGAEEFLRTWSSAHPRGEA